MAIVRLGAHTPAANTSYVLYSVTTSYLASVIAANTLTSSTTATKVDIWVVPQGVATASGYAYITSNLEVGLGQSFETFKFGVNAGDTVFVRSTTAGTSFVIQGMDQNNEYSINNVPITFTNKIIRGNDNIIYPNVGNTASRPEAAEVGYWRYNTDLNYIEFKTPTGWAAAVGPTGPSGNPFGGGTFTAGIAVQGAITATGDITANTSDNRLKIRIGNIENALSKVQQLNGFHYTNSDVAKSLGYTTDELQVGVSAQEVQSVLPEVVVLAPIDRLVLESGEIISKSGENYLTVKYEKIVPLIIEAIKELKAEIDKINNK
jgi:hypothetical protein